MFAEVFRVQSCILRTSISERLVYRADFAFATFVRFLPIVTQVFLWGAIYGTLDPHQSRTINAYTYGDMVAYALLVMLGRAFSSMPGLTTGIARDVRDGSIKKFLTQPIDLLDYLLWHRVAHKLVYYLVAAGPFAIVFWLCRDYFTEFPGPATLLAAILSLGMSFLIGFLIETLLGLIAFWYLEVSSLIFVYMLLNYFLSGHMLPLDWLPQPYSDLVLWLPFKYLAYVPAAILLGRYQGREIWLELGLEFTWVITLWMICRWTLHRGWKRYSAYGG